MDPFRRSFEGLHKATQEMQAAHRFLVEASQAMQRAGESMTASYGAIVDARDTHEDLVDHVTRLEGMILNLTKEVRELRDGRSNGGTR